MIFFLLLILVVVAVTLATNRTSAMLVIQMEVAREIKRDERKAGR